MLTFVWEKSSRIASSMSDVPATVKVEGAEPKESVFVFGDEPKEVKLDGGRAIVPTKDEVQSLRHARKRKAEDQEVVASKGARKGRATTVGAT